MKTGWTGGQYSIYRGIFGACLFVYFIQLLPSAPELFSNEGLLSHGDTSPLVRWFPNILAVADAPIIVSTLVAIAIGSSLLLAIGWHDRVAALAIWYVWACLIGRMPLIVSAGIPFTGWLLLAHACLPGSPYLSLSARGRLDPSGGWRMNHGIWAVAWILMAVGYCSSGIIKLNSASWLHGSALADLLHAPHGRTGLVRNTLLLMPDGLLTFLSYSVLALVLSFAPLALFRRLRPWLWLFTLILSLLTAFLLDVSDWIMGILFLHLFTFDPAWVGPRQPNAIETVFYDGDCGLCHRAVRFVLAEDDVETKFQFAPLGGEAFAKLLDAGNRQSFPDSIVVQTATGSLLTKSRAVFHILQRLGGLWRVIAIVCSIIPARLRDILYDGVARVRKRLFAKPAAACPVLPAHLRKRFLA